MKNGIRTFITGLSLVATSLWAIPAAQAQSADSGAYPNRPIRIIVPWAPGGLTDVLARSLAQKLTESLGQSVIVENRPGASGSIGTGVVATATPDGYTLLISNTDTHALVPALRSKPPYDSVKDFTPISRVGSQAVVLTVNASVPVKSAAELVTLAKSKPGQVSYASWGNGTVSHLAAEMFSGPAGIQMVHVPYKGVSPAVLDVVAGRVDSIFISIASAGDNLPSGKLRPLAISSKTRSKLLPDVPTVAELGYPDFEINLWYGLSAPAGTPVAVVRKLNEAVHAAVGSQDMKERFAKIGLELGGSTPEAFGEFVVTERQRWVKVVQDAKVKIE
jgi:tripartite-type tricarboxylate transporter receptor subunit TctC